MKIKKGLQILTMMDGTDREASGNVLGSMG